jgi:hypothetical protein
VAAASRRLVSQPRGTGNCKSTPPPSHISPLSNPVVMMDLERNPNKPCHGNSFASKAWLFRVLMPCYPGLPNPRPHWFTPFTSTQFMNVAILWGLTKVVISWRSHGDDDFEFPPEVTFLLPSLTCDQNAFIAASLEAYKILRGQVYVRYHE